MEITKNYYLSNKKFLNFEFGKRNFKNFYLLPTVILSTKNFINWEVERISLVFVWFNFFIQINMNNIIKEVNIEIYRETIISLNKILKENQLEVIDHNAAVSYLSKNTYIILLLKNVNSNHQYLSKIIYSFFNNQPFIKNHNTNN